MKLILNQWHVMLFKIILILFMDYKIHILLYIFSFFILITFMGSLKFKD